MGVCVFLFILLPLLTNGQILLDLPDPIIVLVGPTGSGKSSLANALLGCDPKSSNCLFEVCDNLDSCTKETTYGTGRWLGVGLNFTVVDSPGFGDSDGEDLVLIEEMVTVLKETIKHSSTILLVLKGTETRFNDALQDMLTQMWMIFGDQWWNYMVVGVTFWKLDQESIDEREGNCEHYPESCKNEEWFMREINAQLEEKFHIQRNLTYAFIDSYSQAWPDNEDPVQEEHFQAEADVLWQETINRNSTIFFKGIDDVLRENAEMKEKIKWLEDVITNNITELMSRMEANEENDRNQGTTLTHLEEDLIPGIGSIIPWIPSPDGPDAALQSKIPTGWQKCDGSLILSGPLINLRTPNLNGQGLFLRGGDDSLVTTVQEDMVLDHAHIDPGHSHTDGGHTHSDSGHTHTDGGHTHSDGGHTHTDGGHTHSQRSHKHQPTPYDTAEKYWGDYVVLQSSHETEKTKSSHNNRSSNVPTAFDINRSQNGGYYSAAYRSFTSDAQPLIYSAYANIRSARASITTSHASITTSHANIHSSSASIHSSKSGVSTVDDHYKMGQENRPKNMVVTYVMRIF